ncbi:LacI family transcriptional regulator [Actinoplanes sp. OR16]|nr:LacI family transcriptional regulator [Actinoplanes sp. OR16]
MATVSRVLADNYPTAPATRAKVMRAVRDLDYVVNVHARALAGISAKMVAVVVDAVTAPFYAHVAQGAEEQAAEDGRLCLICTTGGDPARELAIVKLMREQRADAVILVGSVVQSDDYRARMSQYAHALDAAGARLVLCGRPPLGPDTPALSSEYDNAGGAYAITSHLLSAGHQRILFLGSSPGGTTADARVDGYRRALADHRVPVDPGLEVPGGFGRPAGYRMMRDRLAAGPPDFTAVFAGDDSVAAGAWQALRENGLRVPGDISLVGYNDDPMAAELGLTTVHIPALELGRAAVRQAIRGEGEAPARTMLGTHIVVRDSVRPHLRTP